jgi:hypothetical protein
MATNMSRVFPYRAGTRHRLPAFTTACPSIVRLCTQPQALVNPRATRSGVPMRHRTPPSHRYAAAEGVVSALSRLSQSQFASVDSVTKRKGGCGHVSGINGAITPALMEIRALWPHHSYGPNWVSILKIRSSCCYPRVPVMQAG